MLACKGCKKILNFYLIYLVSMLTDKEKYPTNIVHVQYVYCPVTLLLKVIKQNMKPEQQ